MAKRQIKFSHLLRYMKKTEQISGEAVKQLIKDVGVRLRPIKGLTVLRYHPLSMETVRKVLTLRFQQRGAREIRRRRRVQKTLEGNIVVPVTTAR